jgi:phospholipid/cholesterol/gamma-HCH transport system substrate-binding protein
MASVKTKFTVGLFVAAGFFLAAVAIIWLGMSHYFEKGHFCVAYFDESVQGLSKDSPVKYRGVSIGRVYRLQVAPDATLIEAVLQIDPEIVKPAEMVAQLKNVGITGSMFIDLDRKKPGDTALSPRLSFAPPFPVVITKPSQIKEFMGDVREILNNIKKLNMERVAAKLSGTLDDFRAAVKGARIPAVSEKLRTVLDRIAPLLDEKKWDRVLGAVTDAAHSVEDLSGPAADTAEAVTASAAELQRLIGDSRPGITAAVEELEAATQDARTLFRRGAILLQDADGRFSNLQYHLVETLSNLNQATIALNRFLDLIANQPSQLLFGEPPPPRPVGKENGPP